MSRRRPVEVVQGIDLIEAAIERVKADPHAVAGFCGDNPLHEPRPMPKERLATLTFRTRSGGDVEEEAE
jgi:hypothetical protein